MFSEILNQLLKEKKITAKTLSKAIGISTSVLSEYKLGRAEPTAGKLSLISDYFGVSVDYLLGRSPTLNHIGTMSGRAIGIQSNSKAVSEAAETKNLGETEKQLLEEFSKLSLADKAKTINFICEMVKE